jgi:protein tyrosine phosphatase (PTP) superfamily phosphohydrolase (DUF442 family)
MDITWVTDRIAVGGGIWTADNMAAVARAGITHIIDMQIEFDDTPLAVPHEIKVCWNPIDDDFEAKPAEVFVRGVAFGLAALDEPQAKVFVHCAAGVHRAAGGGFCRRLRTERGEVFARVVGLIPMERERALRSPDSRRDAGVTVG